jgi:predicted DNA-binding WGR domain protein
VLHRIDPEQGIRRFYSLMIERDLFGTIRLVRKWGRIGTNGQELVEAFASEVKAGQALEAVARAKRKNRLAAVRLRRSLNQNSTVSPWLSIAR